jgi:fluoroquinolone resistance protein
MKSQVTTEQTFDKHDFRQQALAKGEYESCIFCNCDFSNSDLSEVFFLSCEFLGCNLSMAKLTKTTLRDVKFRDCKMLGIRFDNCNQFGLAIYIESCTLNHSSFYQAKLKNTIFRHTNLHEVDFTQCDLTGSVFDNCDLTGAMFENTILEKTDFTTSHSYSIDPEINRVKKAKFSLQGVAGLLYKYDIEIDGII